MRYKKGQQIVIKEELTVQEFIQWMLAYASRGEIVDPNGRYKMTITNVWPTGERPYLHRLEFERVDRKIR